MQNQGHLNLISRWPLLMQKDIVLKNHDIIIVDEVNDVIKDTKKRSLHRIL